MAMGRSRPLSSHTWGSRAGVGRRTQLDVQRGPGLAIQGVEVEAGLSSSPPHSGEGLEELSELTVVGVVHSAGSGQDH